jgi:hypothetical protein
VKRALKSIRGWVLPALFGAGVPLLAFEAELMWLSYLWIAASLVFFVYVVWARLIRRT